MWSDAALQFLGMITNPVVLLLPVLLCVVTRRKLWIVLGTSGVAAGLGAIDALAVSRIHEGLVVVAMSAAAGVVAAEIALAIVLPLAMMALSGVLWFRGRRRRPDDQAP